MQQDFKIKGILRIIDANANRAKEGLRVCEEVARFCLNSKELTSKLKYIRHSLDNDIDKLLGSKINLISARSSAKDVGKKISKFEFRRRDLKDIFLANIQRVKESIRVLEEFSKLKNKRIALDFKSARYALYELEKKITERITTLYHSR